MPVIVVDPTPEEIRKRAEQIRKEWSDDERLRRLGYRKQKPVPYVPEIYHVTGRGWS